jgi:membrane associated rhomboid family serine protease
VARWPAGLRFHLPLIEPDVRIPLPYASEAPLRRPPVAALAIVLLCFLAFPLGYTEWGGLHLFEWSGDPSIPMPRPEGMPDDIEMPTPGRFAWYQLITSQFMHGGIEHLIGNIVMLLVVGPKVNDLLGNGKFLLAYLTLGVVAGLPPLFFNMGGPPAVGLGASGAIMGIAGIYLVFSPQPRIRMVWWLRFFVFSPLFAWLFRVRGIWLVLILFALDLIAIFRGSTDHVAHDVHFTGFTVGALSAAMLVALRWVKCGGVDLLTWLFGQEDVEEDRDIDTGDAEEWSGISNAPVILFPFIAAVLFAVGAFLYRVIQFALEP